jgi:hypothetical protein
MIEPPAGLSTNEMVGHPRLVSELGAFEASSYHNALVLELSTSLSGPLQTPLFREWDLDPEIVAEHYNWDVPPPIRVFGVPDHVLGGGGLLSREGALWIPGDCYPDYIAGMMLNGILPSDWGGSLHLRNPTEVLVDEPCACPLHPNLVFGHFLLEVLPRLFILRMLRDMGVSFRVAVHRTVPEWVWQFLAIYFPGEEYILYDSHYEVVRAPLFIVPSMMHTQKSHIHPLLSVLTSDLRTRGVSEASPVEKNRSRIYLSRRRAVTQWHRIENEDQVEETLDKIGFCIIHPQELSIREQLHIYANADCICSEYSSALHNSMFAKRATKVIGLNRVNWYQSLIGRVMSQPLAIIPPSDGKMRDWRLYATSKEHISFRIDCDRLRSTVTEFLDI